jgi:hypothetical protein
MAPLGAAAPAASEVYSGKIPRYAAGYTTTTPHLRPCGSVRPTPHLQPPVGGVVLASGPHAGFRPRCLARVGYQAAVCCLSEPARGFSVLATDGHQCPPVNFQAGMQQPGILQPAEPDSLSIGHRRFTEAV